MKRIAIWGHFCDYGGIERMVYNFYQYLDRDKVQFDFVVPHDCGKIAFEDEILAMGGRVFRVLYSERESIKKAKKSWMKFFNEHPEIEGIHVHANFPYAFPLVMAKKAGIPLRILHSHNSDVAEPKNPIKRVIRKIKVSREINKYPTLYLSCSDLAADFMFPKKKYTWLKNGVEIEKFAFDKSKRIDIREKNGFNNDETIIGVIGHLNKVKNPTYALEIMKEYVKINPKAKLVFLGAGELRSLVETKINEYDLQNNVQLMGLKKDISEWYSALDVLLMPSKHEGFPVVLVEAQVSGLLCLVSDKITKQVNETKLVKYLSIDLMPTAWIKEMQELSLNNSIERDKYKIIMKNAGYSIEDVSKEIENIYITE